jgi:hypothetical protein
MRINIIEEVNQNQSQNSDSSAQSSDKLYILQEIFYKQCGKA